MKNLIRTLIYGGQVSLTVADTTEIVKEGARLHGLSKASAYVFGKALSAMTFMSACLKNERGEISLSLKGEEDEEIGVSGNKTLRIRGFIGKTDLAGEGDFTAERAFLGNNASVTIIRDDGYNRPFVGACALPENGGLDEGFEEYFRISEQLPTRIKTAVEFDENGVCCFAGFAVLQPLPFADEEVLTKTAEVDLSELLAAVETQGVAESVKQRFATEDQVWEERKAAYKCNCSRERVEKALITLGSCDLYRMLEEQKQEGKADELEVSCRFCGRKEIFNRGHIDKMVEDMK